MTRGPTRVEPDPYQRGFAPVVIGRVARADFGKEDIADVLVMEWAGWPVSQIVRLRDGRWAAVYGGAAWVSNDADLLLAAVSPGEVWQNARALPGCPERVRVWLEAIHGLHALARP